MVHPRRFRRPPMTGLVCHQSGRVLPCSNSFGCASQVFGSKFQKIIQSSAIRRSSQSRQSDQATETMARARVSTRLVSVRLFDILAVGPDGVLNGVLVFPFLDTRHDAIEMRRVSRALRACVARFAWHDLSSLVSSVMLWRQCFPLACACQVSDRLRLTDADIGLYFGGGRIHALVIQGQVSLTDAAFAHLAGIKQLDMTWCNQPTITDAAFVHLKGIHTLTMSDCRQTTITDAAFAHLAGIHTLHMFACRQATITDAAFSHLAGIHTLCIFACNQSTISDAAFAHLPGIFALDMGKCSQATITDAAFAHLAGIHTLRMKHCNQMSITDAAFAPLAGIRNLDISGCDQVTITDNAFVQLAGIRAFQLRADHKSWPWPWPVHVIRW